MRITTRTPKDGRARMRREREICVDGTRVACVAPAFDGSGFYFYSVGGRLPTRNTLNEPYQGQRTWVSNVEAATACVAFVREHASRFEGSGA